MFSNLDYRTDIVPFILATVGEFSALFFWLHFIDDDKLLIANLVLWSGFMVERISVALWVRYVYRQKTGEVEPSLTVGGTVFRLFLFTLSEILIWVVWVLTADEVSQLVAAFLLLPLMQVEHAVEMAILKKTNSFLYILNGTTLFFTFIEVLGAVGWLYFVRDGNALLGGIVLLIGLSIEHVIQGIQLKPKSADDPMEQHPFMMMVSIKEGEEPILSEILTEMGNDVDGSRLATRKHKVHLDFTKSPSTHFARFVVLEDPDNGIDKRRLLFSSNYDGMLENYLKELDAICTDDIHKAIWERVEGYTDKAHFKAFLRHENAKINVDTFYVGIRGETVKRIHNYIKVRREFDKKPNRPYWRSHRYGTIFTNSIYFLRGVFAVLGVVPFMLRHPIATIKTIQSLQNGLPHNPVGKGYSNALPDDCRHTIPCLNDHAPPTAVTQPQQQAVVGEDVIAQNQMNVISDIVPQDLYQLKVFLKILNAAAKGITADGNLSGISTIHFARWVVIDNNKRLLFISNYDGSWENYIGDFSDKAYKGLDTVWRSSQGYPGSQDIEAFKQQIRCRQVQSHYFYSAYPHETVQNILNDRAMSI